MQYFFTIDRQRHLSSVLMPKTSESMNIGMLCNLYNLVIGTENLMKNYIFEEKEEYTRKLKETTIKGRNLLDKLQSLLRKIASQFEVEINEEFVPLKGTNVCLPYLSIGTLANEAKGSIFVRFISRILSDSMGLTVPSLSFFIFYLPPQLSAITVESFHMESVGGFTNTNRGNRVEFNIYPNRDLENIFSNIAHEIIHCAVLADLSLKHSETLVESLMQDFIKLYLPLADYKLKRIQILKSLDDLIQKKYKALLAFDDYIDEKFAEEMKACKEIINTLQQFGEDIHDQKIILSPKENR